MVIDRCDSKPQVKTQICLRIDLKIVQYVISEQHINVLAMKNQIKT